MTDSMNTDNGNKARSAKKGIKLRSALRDNLKKRKGQVRKLGQGGDEVPAFSVKLRARDIPKAGKSVEDKNKE